MASWCDFAKKWIPGPLFIVGVGTMSLPVGYIIKKHMDWKKNPDAKKRMLIHHLVFWGASVPALKTMHIAWGELKVLLGKPQKTPYTRIFKGAGYLSAASGILIGAFEGGDRLARILVPKPPKPVVPAQPAAAPPVILPLPLPLSAAQTLPPIPGFSMPTAPPLARPYAANFSLFR